MLPQPGMEEKKCWNLLRVVSSMFWYHGRAIQLSCIGGGTTSTAGLYPGNRECDSDAQMPNVRRRQPAYLYRTLHRTRESFANRSCCCQRGDYKKKGTVRHLFLAPFWRRRNRSGVIARNASIRPSLDVTSATLRKEQ